jgi:arsenate reductase (thioredoxin)
MKRIIRQRNLLFLCDDGCLSQMAEAIANHISPPNASVFSAAVTPGTIPTQAYKVMEELGIRLSGPSAKGLDAVPVNEIDRVISFGDADRRCDRLPPKARIERWSIPNPGLNSGAGVTVLSLFRHRRDEIDRRVFALFLDHWRSVA